MLNSQLCKLDSLKSPRLLAWGERIRPIWDPDGSDPKETIIHRKMWEWLYISEAISERGMLSPGHSGVGFGVGNEPLVALFASSGCEVLATDLDPDRAFEAGWTRTGAEYAGGLEELNPAGICDPHDFVRLVSYQNVDMNSIPHDLGEFDFCWSSCALEHLGSLEAGIDFVFKSLGCVKPGGVAVHTTECNVSSDVDTIATGPTVLYRRRDLLELSKKLTNAGYRIAIDLSEGETPEDLHVDVPPLSDIHLRTMLGEFVTTSVALVIEKPPDWTPPRTRWFIRGLGSKGMRHRR